MRQFSQKGYIDISYLKLIQSKFNKITEENNLNKSFKVAGDAVHRYDFFSLFFVENDQVQFIKDFILK